MWAQVVNALLGVWLMVAPFLIGYGSPAEVNDRIVGPLVAACAVISWWEVTRPVRWANFPLGLWLIVSPWVLGYDQPSIWLHSFAVGTAVALLAAVRGQVTGRYGGGWSVLWRSER